MVGLAPEGEQLSDLLVVSLQSIVLFPGQTLPLSVTRPTVVRALKDLLEGAARLLVSEAHPSYTFVYARRRRGLNADPITRNFQAHASKSTDGSARRLLLVASPAAIESERALHVGTTGGTSRSRANFVLGVDGTAP